MNYNEVTDFPSAALKRESSGVISPDMNIACVTSYDARNPRSFGGRVYHQLRAVHEISPMQFVGPLSYIKQAGMLYLKREYHKRLKGRRYTPYRDSWLVKDYSRQISRHIKKSNPDVILSPMSPGSQPIAYLETKKPIVIWTDTTFAGWLDFYPEAQRDSFCEETLRDGIENERLALNRSALAIFYSEWAAQNAISFYDLDPTKVRVVPPGPAMDTEFSLRKVKNMIQARPNDRCRLLFVGMIWERKGGDIALDVATQLNVAGLPTELVLVGCVPPNKSLPDFVRPLGYLDRTKPQDRETLDELYKTSHFMFVPTRAEALGLIFCEAAAFGLPSLSTAVGGVPEVIRNGITGVTFPLSAPAARYAEYLEDLFLNYHRYEPMALAAFHDFQTRLNNRSAATSVVNAMVELL